VGDRLDDRVPGREAGELELALIARPLEALTREIRVVAERDVGCVALENGRDDAAVRHYDVRGANRGERLPVGGMRERAAVLGGVLEVAPREEGGTRVAAWFPPAPGGAGSGR